MVHWHSKNGMDTLRREIDRAFEDFGFRTQPWFRTAFLPSRAAQRYPLINVWEDRDALYVEALAPGMDAASLEISVVHNILMISGGKPRLSGDVQPEAFHRSERGTGKFRCTVELPVEVDAERIEANYRHGLLVITLPKVESAKPKHIEIQVA
ncbi:Spore protein SP21 [Candidatus Entotheonellaceae bacterium PAL068K]